MLEVFKNFMNFYDFLRIVGVMKRICFLILISAAIGLPMMPSVVRAQDKLDETEERYREELKRLQREIEMLKIKVLETRKALKNFEDMILLGTLTGTKITVYFKNELRSAEIQDISVVLDGFEVSRIKDEKRIKEAREREIVIYDEAEAIPGKHVVDIVFTIKGEKLFKKALRYEFEVEKGVATVIRTRTRKAPESKFERSPEDIDILVSSERSKIISK